MQLILPPSADDDEESIWVRLVFKECSFYKEIKPWASKEIAQLQFLSSNSGDHQGFVSVRTKQDVHLIIHVEVGVVKGM